MEFLTIKKTGADACRLGHIGSVTDVIAAVFPQDLLNRRFRAADFLYAFEIGTPKEKDSLGETIIVNGICYTTSTDINSDEYYQTITGPEFITSGVFLIPHHAKPSHLIEIDAAKLSVSDLYAQMYSMINQPFAFVGVAEFNDFHTTAVSKAPVDGQNIFANKAQYYKFPEKNEKNICAFIMGVIADFNDKEQTEINKQLEAVLYVNPFEKISSLTQHAHVLTLKKNISEIKDINEEIADRSLHLFEENSEIKRLKLEVYTIAGMDNFAL